MSINNAYMITGSESVQCRRRHREEANSSDTYNTNELINSESRNNINADNVLYIDVILILDTATDSVYHVLANDIRHVNRHQMWIICYILHS